MIVFFFVCLLDEVSEHDDCPHLLFYGPSGSGKKTLIMAVVKQMFGAGAEKVRFFLLNLSLLIYLFFFFNLKKKCCSYIVNAVAGEGREQSLES